MVEGAQTNKPKKTRATTWTGPGQSHPPTNPPTPVAPALRPSPLAGQHSMALCCCCCRCCGRCRGPLGACEAGAVLALGPEPLLFLILVQGHQLQRGGGGGRTGLGGRVRGMDGDGLVEAGMVGPAEPVPRASKRPTVLAPCSCAAAGSAPSFTWHGKRQQPCLPAALPRNFPAPRCTAAAAYIAQSATQRSTHLVVGGRVSLAHDVGARGVQLGLLLEAVQHSVVLNPAGQKERGRGSEFVGCREAGRLAGWLGGFGQGLGDGPSAGEPAHAHVRCGSPNSKLSTPAPHCRPGPPSAGHALARRRPWRNCSTHSVSSSPSVPQLPLPAPCLGSLWARPVPSCRSNSRLACVVQRRAGDWACCLWALPCPHHVLRSPALPQLCGTLVTAGLGASWQ